MVEPLEIAAASCGTEGTKGEESHKNNKAMALTTSFQPTMMRISGLSYITKAEQHASSPSAVCTLSSSLNGPKATVKALTEKLYWVPGTRLDSTIVVALPVMFKLMSPAEDDCCSS